MSRQIFNVDSDTEDEIEQISCSEFKQFQKKKKSVPKGKKKKKKPKTPREKLRKEKNISVESSQQQQSGNPKKSNKVSWYKKKKKIEDIVKVDNTEGIWGRQIKEEELMKFGNCKLIRAYCKNPSARYSPKARQTLRTGVTWWIEKGDYEQNNWKEIFFAMYQMFARDLRIIQTKYKNVIKEIHHVRMQSIEILYLFENNIVSIELLARIRLPYLKDLSLRNNYITVIDPLAKMGLDNLEILDLHGNYIIDLSKLYYTNLVSLKNLYLDWKPSNVMVEDISFLSKLKINSGHIQGMESITIQSKDRFFQRKVDQMIGAKYKVPPHLLFKRKMI